MFSQLIVSGDGDRMKYSTPFSMHEIVVFNDPCEICETTCEREKSMGSMLRV